MSFTKRILGQQIDARISANAARRGAHNLDIDHLAKSWAAKTVRMMKENLSKKKITLTRDLIDSLDYDLIDGDTPSIIIHFAAHGRYLDMKELFWHKAPPIDVLEEWVKKRGVNQFGFVPGYGVHNYSALRSAPNAARRIAWAIAKNRANGEAVNQYGRWKRGKVWQNPGGKNSKGNLGTAIGHLKHLLEEEIGAAAEIMISQAITTR
jgi:hypothetical protein